MMRNYHGIIFFFWGNGIILLVCSNWFPWSCWIFFFRNLLHISISSPLLAAIKNIVSKDFLKETSTVQLTFLKKLILILMFDSFLNCWLLINWSIVIHLVMLATSWTYRYYFIVGIFNMQTELMILCVIVVSITLCGVLRLKEGRIKLD